MAILRIPLFTSHSSVFAGDKNCIRTEEFIVDQIVERVSVWSASLKDRPGGLSNLLTCLDDAGVEQWKTEFYDFEGWDSKTGYPKRSTLEKLGLQHAADILQTNNKLGV